jgi:hypothetical protein
LIGLEGYLKEEFLKSEKRGKIPKISVSFSDLYRPWKVFRLFVLFCKSDKIARILGILGGFQNPEYLRILAFFEISKFHL